MYSPHAITDVKERWRYLAQTDETRIPLLWASFVVASDEYEALTFADYDHVLNQHVIAIQRQLPSRDHDLLDRVRALNAVFYEELGYKGNQEDYYDPRNSYLNQVIDRRLGVPISLAVIQIELAKRLQIPLEGVAFPGHFLVRLPVEDGLLVLDPFARGRSLDETELKIRARPHFDNRDVRDNELDHLLMPASSRAILLRMLRNLKQIYAQQNDWDRALRTTDRILILEPQQKFELRDRGVFYLRVGHNRAGIEDLSRYLKEAPEAEDAEQIRQLAIEVGANLSRVN